MRERREDGMPRLRASAEKTTGNPKELKSIVRGVT